MTRFFRILLLGLSLIATLGAVFYLYQFNQKQLSEKLPVIAQVPDFTLTDEQNHPFMAQTLRGKVWVVDFIFTSCQGQCPALSATFKELQERYSDASRVQFLSISVDPEHDTPAALAEYAKRFNALDGRWHFLTGTEPVIRDLMIKGFKIGSDKDPNLHSTFFVLVDQRGQIRGYYDGFDNQAMGRLRRDLKILLKQS